MVELSAKSPCADLLPVTIGAFRLTEVDLGRLTGLAPYTQAQEALSKVLNTAHDVPYPAPNQVVAGKDAQIIWFGRDMALLAGPEPAADLARHAALTDQSDAWASVRLDGAQAEAVLARLVPIDLRPSVFGAGQTCRTLLNHMNASITRQPDGAFVILVFRSMAATLVHELQEAMEAVAARG